MEHNSLQSYMLHSYELGSYAWLTVVEIDDRAVKDQRKYLPRSLLIHIVFRKAKNFLFFLLVFFFVMISVSQESSGV